MTNIENLRMMTAEELAQWIDTRTNGCDACPLKRKCLYDEEKCGMCADLWLDWLREEAKEDT